jgi:hypothetical protein
MGACEGAFPPPILQKQHSLQLFKQSTALLQTIDCGKVWGKQWTETEQGSTHCLV